jgi:predicted Zn-dependent protease
LKFIGQQLMFTPEDTRLYSSQAQAYGAIGNQMSQHRAQAEVYARQGKLPAAVEQLEIALRTTDPDFYQASSVEARLRELRELTASKSKAK